MKTPFHLIMLKTFHAQRNKVRPYMELLSLSPGQPKILSFLVINNNCLQKDLARSCDIEAATVSKLLNNMEENGLINRSAIPNNKRAINISITDKGRGLEHQIKTYMNELEKLSLKGFSEKEKDEFICYLCRMYNNLTNNHIK